MANICQVLKFSGGSEGKESTCNAGDMGLISESGRFPGEGHGNPLQYSCLENPMDRGAWRATVPGVTKELDKTERLIHTHTHTHTPYTKHGDKHTCIIYFSPHSSPIGSGLMHPLPDAETESER